MTEIVFNHENSHTELLNNSLFYKCSEIKFWGKFLCVIFNLHKLRIHFSVFYELNFLSEHDSFEAVAGFNPGYFPGISLQFPLLYCFLRNFCHLIGWEQKCNLKVPTYERYVYRGNQPRITKEFRKNGGKFPYFEIQKVQEQK